MTQDLIGCAFSFAHFINDRGGAEVMEAYRQHFRPSAWLASPRGSVGVFALCADTEDEANRIAASRDLWRLQLDLGEIGPIPSVEDALAYPYSDLERRRIAFNRHRMFVGAPEQVKARLLELGTAYGIDEFIVVSICYDFQARLHSYALLAEAFGLRS